MTVCLATTPCAPTAACAASSTRHSPLCRNNSRQSAVVIYRISPWQLRIIKWGEDQRTRELNLKSPRCLSARSSLYWVSRPGSSARTSLQRAAHCRLLHLGEEGGGHLSPWAGEVRVDVLRKAIREGLQWPSVDSLGRRAGTGRHSKHVSSALLF